MRVHVFSVPTKSIKKISNLFCTEFNFTTSMRARILCESTDEINLPVVHALHFLSIHFLHFVFPLAFASLPSLTVPFFLIIYRLITADNTNRRGLWRRRRCLPPARSCSRTLCNSGFIHDATLLAIGPSRDSRLHPHRLGN